MKGTGADVVSTNIVDTLQNVRKGAMLFDLADKLERLVRTIRETGKPGSIRLKLTLTPEPGDAAALMVVDSLDGTEPKPDKAATYFFATEKGTLQREDPRQAQFPAGAGFGAE